MHYFRAPKALEKSTVRCGIGRQALALPPGLRRRSQSGKVASVEKPVAIAATRTRVGPSAGWGAISRHRRCVRVPMHARRPADEPESGRPQGQRVMPNSFRISLVSSAVGRPLVRRLVRSRPPGRLVPILTASSATEKAARGRAAQTRGSAPPFPQNSRPGENYAALGSTGLPQAMSDDHSSSINAHWVPLFIVLSAVPRAGGYPRLSRSARNTNFPCK
jgi:hypothetical protein